MQDKAREVFTPDQAAEYLQVNRETVYRYIRDGRLTASKLGRNYRIRRSSLDILLWATRTRQDVTLRDYTREEVDGFVERDALDNEADTIRRRFLERAKQQRSKHSNTESSVPSVK